MPVKSRKMHQNFRSFRIKVVPLRKVFKTSYEVMKKVLLTTVLLVATLMISAQVISQQQAKERAAAFLKSSTGAARRAVSQSQMEAAAVAVDNIYAFNLEGGGFVIASGDERALPVLGYSTSGKLDWDNMPANMRWWLQGYSEAIKSLGDEVLVNAPRVSRAKIEPLVKTLWDQSPVFNNDCPVYNGKVTSYAGKLCVTGCVATAMAQVMYYHKWPQNATTVIPAYKYSVSNLQENVEESFDLPELSATTFDWNNMVDRYLTSEGEQIAGITEAQVKAVSKLMRYCGQAIKMDYSPNISLAYDQDACNALITNFGYDKGTRFIQRMNFSIDEWETLIYDELAAQRPVIYGGMSDDGGHCFVCDGYDGNGLFHINWGWGGYADNYFSLSVLNSNASNVSGVARPGIGFCIGQDAIIGIQKPTSGTTPTSLLPKLGTLKNYTVASDAEGTIVYVSYDYINSLYPTATFDLQLFAEKSDGTWQQLTNIEQQKLESQSNHSYGFSLPKTDTSLPDGTTRIYPRFKCLSVTGSDWQLLADRNHYVERTVKGGAITYRSMPSVDGLKVTKCEISKGEQAVNTPNDLTLTIDNSGAEYSGVLLLSPVSVDNDNLTDALATVKGDGLWPNYYEELKKTLVVGAYIKGNSTDNKLTFSFTPPYDGNYVFMLSEQSADSRYKCDPFAYMGITGIKSSTGIEKVESTTQPAGIYYDLQGRRLSGQPSKGIYILNGRKYVVR